MIRTLSTTSSNTSCSSNEHPSSNQSRRSTLHSIARRLSDSKKNLLEHMPQHQEQFTRFRKRAKSFFATNLFEHLSELQQSTSQRRNSTTSVEIEIDFVFSRYSSKIRTYSNDKFLSFRSSVSMKSTDVFILHMETNDICMRIVLHHQSYFNHLPFSMTIKPNKSVQRKLIN